MIKRLSKARRTAILEHLLALEKQIREEFGENPETRRTRHLSESDLRSSRPAGGAAESRTIINEFTARSVH
jgi:hypothetical protein